jgi:hypothetical protein
MRKRDFRGLNVSLTVDEVLLLDLAEPPDRLQRIGGS